MEITFNNLTELTIAFEAGKIETPQFVSIREYTNKLNETSNYLINLGTNYHNAKLADNALLHFLDADDFEVADEIKPFMNQALEALRDASTKNLSNNIEDHTIMSKAQIDMYETLLPNIKIHKEKEIIYLFGMQIKKTVITPGEYKTVKSRPLTIAKNAIRKQFATGKYRQFYLSEIKNIKINGKEIIFEM